MAPRPTWKGFLKLSLVSVPVKAFTANETSAEIHLNQLHAACHNRIRYQKTCPEHGEVAAEDIVSGYEYAKGQYVVVDPEEVDKLRTASDKAINIQGFVDEAAIEPRYHAGRTYFVLPDGAVGQKPYALVHKVMADRHVNALAKVVIASREQLVLLRPLDGMLAMTILHHDAKVKKPAAFTDELVAQTLAEEELALTRTLVDATLIRDLDYAKYRDDYVDKLGKLIQAKVEGQEVVQVPDREEPKILNLMDALKRSVAQAQASGVGDEAAPAAAAAESAESAEPVAAPAKKKMAPSATGKAPARRRKSG